MSIALLDGFSSLATEKLEISDLHNLLGVLESHLFELFKNF